MVGVLIECDRSLFDTNGGNTSGSSSSREEELASVGLILGANVKPTSFLYSGRHVV